MDNQERWVLIAEILALEVGHYRDFKWPGKKQAALFRVSMAPKLQGRIITVKRITETTARAMRVY